MAGCWAGGAGWEGSAPFWGAGPWHSLLSGRPLPAGPVPLLAAMHRFPCFRRCRRGWQVAQDIAEALAFLHGRGVLHGDLKPG